jgi:cofilin
MNILNYDVLRTSKAALDEGLIDQTDYDAVKSSFLRAQQIKAGLDAGFIPEAEYTNVKKAFLESLDIGLPSSGGPTSMNHAPGEAQV